jgi:hypothetical protein
MNMTAEGVEKLENITTSTLMEGRNDWLYENKVTYKGKGKVVPVL